MTRVADPRRLAALRTTGLVAGAVFPGLDRLTGMACRLLRVPIALVSVVEADRQWFASAVGLPEPWATARQTPLTHSFCQYVVHTARPLITSDARTDRMLSRSLATTEIGVIAYAGYPLYAPNDEILGTFCAIDVSPRDWTGDELRAVEDFAAIAAAEIAARSTTAAMVAARRDADRGRAFLDALVDSLDTGVTACDEHGDLVLFNRAMRLILDVDEEVGGGPDEWTSVFTIADPEGRPLPVENMPLVRALRGEHVRDVDVCLSRPGSPEVRMRVNAQPIIGSAGQRLGAVAVCEDVTERRRAEQFKDTELAVHRALITGVDTTIAVRTVLEAVGTTLGWVHAELWLADEAGTTLRPAATWTSDSHASTVPVPVSIGPYHGLAGTAWNTGQPIWIPDIAADPHPLGGEAATRAGLRAALAVPVHSGEHTIGVLTIFSAAPQLGDASYVAFLSGTALHIGEYLQRRRAEALARQLAQAKDEYVALVGHELRTPLTSVASYVELISDMADDTPLAQVRDLLAIVHRNTAQLRAIIDDLLDLAALDSGQAVLSSGRVNLALIVNDAVAALERPAHAQGLTFRVQTPRDIGVLGDPQRLRQLVDNVIGNAVKYSPDGGNIDVRLSARDGHAELVVADTGIGIPAEERADVFRRFYRSTRTREHAIPGTGLGLALCQIIADLHHGEITIADSARDDSGTTVVTRLPLP